MTSDRALTTDDVMAELKISRGNAHQNLRELAGWGLIRSVIRKGERKEFFEAEKRRLAHVLYRRPASASAAKLSPPCAPCAPARAKPAALRGEKAAAFNRQIRALSDFLAQAQGIMERVSKSEQSTIVPLILRLLPKSK